MIEWEEPVQRVDFSSTISGLIGYIQQEHNPERYDIWVDGECVETCYSLEEARAKVLELFPKD